MSLRDGISAFMSLGTSTNKTAPATTAGAPTPFAQPLARSCNPSPITRTTRANRAKALVEAVLKKSGHGRGAWPRASKVPNIAWTDSRGGSSEAR